MEDEGLQREKRKICYICGPAEGFDLRCPNNPDHKITWSEYEKHIWCYDCEKDIEYKPELMGPIPVAVAYMMGIDYRSYNIKTGDILELPTD